MSKRVNRHRGKQLELKQQRKDNKKRIEQAKKEGRYG